MSYQLVEISEETHARRSRKKPLNGVIVGSAVPVSASSADSLICDPQFMDDVTQLKELRSYLIRQAKSPEAGTVELGDLNLLRFDEKGRLPTRGEWIELEERSSELYQHLTEVDRRRFLYGQIPQFVIKTALVLGAITIGALVAAFEVATTFSQYNLFWTLVCCVVWVAALGALGSIAFIGMNALAVQEDATFDITNQKLVSLRVVLGAILGLILTLPFGFAPFSQFTHALMSDKAPDASTPIFLLLPFILGFSTTLVITILNQCIEALRTFFGTRGVTVSAGTQAATTVTLSRHQRRGPPVVSVRHRGKAKSIT